MTFDYSRFYALCDFAWSLDDLGAYNFHDTYKSKYAELAQAIRSIPAWVNDAFLFREALLYGALVYGSNFGYDLPEAKGVFPEDLRDKGELILLLKCALPPSEAAKLPKDDGILFKDSSILLAAVGEKWSFIRFHPLKYASPALLRNREFMLEAIEQDPLSLQYASKELRDDRKLVLTAVQQDGFALKFASLRLRDDYEIVMAAMRWSSVFHVNPLRFASVRLCDREDVVLAASRIPNMRNSECMRYASKRLHTEFFKDDCSWELDYYQFLRLNDTSSVNPDLEAEIIAHFGKNKYDDEEPFRLYAFFAAFPEKLTEYPEYQDNWHLMRYLVSVDGSTLRLASKALRNTWEIVSIAVDNDPDALRYASERLRQNPLILEKTRFENKKIVYYDILNRFEYYCQQLGPDSAYQAAWDLDGAPPQVGQIRTVRVKGSFSARIGDEVYILYSPFSDRLLRDHLCELRFTRCRLLASMQSMEASLHSGGPEIQVEVVKIWTADELSRESFPKHRLTTPHYQFGFNHSNWESLIGPYSWECCGYADVEYNKWLVYTDACNTDHVLLYENYFYNFDDRYTSTFTLGNSILGDRIKRRAKKLMRPIQTEDGRFLYGWEPFTPCLIRYLKDNTRVLTVPSLSQLRPAGIMYAEENSFIFQVRESVIIGEEAFRNCTVLEEVHLPARTGAIGRGAFLNCVNLKRVELPDSIFRIDDRAFGGCRSLTSIFIPDSVMKIGEKAFDECPTLTLTVGRGSHAEQYCIENKLKYVYNDLET